jgi:hypothetical protein
MVEPSSKESFLDDKRRRQERQRGGKSRMPKLPMNSAAELRDMNEFSGIRIVLIGDSHLIPLFGKGSVRSVKTGT